MKRKLLLVFLVLVSTFAICIAKTTFKIDGITYLVRSDGQTVEVFDFDSKGKAMTIPSEVKYNGRSYRVTNIGKQSFNEEIVTNALRPMIAINTTSSGKVSPTLPTEIIVEQPQGILKDKLYRSASGYTYSSGSAYAADVDGDVAKLVISDNNELYLYSPISFYPTKSWIKGYKDKGDTITFTFPQLIYQQGDASYYARKMKIGTKINDYGEEYETYVVDTLSQTIKFIWRNDSLLKCGDDMLALTTSDARWTGYGDVTLSIFNLPENLINKPNDENSAKLYKMSIPTSETTTDNRIVKIAKEGDSIYFKGFYNNTSDAWVKAVKEGNKYMLKGKQYLGIDTINNIHVFFSPAHVDSTMMWDEVFLRYKLSNEMNWEYNEVDDSFATDSAFIINYGQLKTSIMARYPKASFTPWQDVVATPKDPEFVFVRPNTGDYGYYKFTIPTISTDGEYINAENLAYNIYYNDELVTFFPDEYKGLKSELTDIPYYFSDGYEITMDGDLHKIYYYSLGIDKIGVQSIYKGGGEVKKSSIVSYDISAQSITNATNNSRQKISYKDISGRNVNYPTKGLFIKVMENSDGTLTTSKVVR